MQVFIWKTERTVGPWASLAGQPQHYALHDEKGRQRSRGRHSREARQGLGGYSLRSWSMERYGGGGVQASSLVVLAKLAVVVFGRGERKWRLTLTSAIQRPILCRSGHFLMSRLFKKVKTLLRGQTQEGVSLIISV